MPIPNEHINQFKKGESGNPNGRPRKYVSTLIDQGYKRSEINDTIQNMMAMTLEEVKAVWDNPTATVLEKTIASAIRKSIEKGTLYSLETLLSRVYGQPKQEVAASITPQPIWQGVKLQVDTDNDCSQD
jgi:hypothetical protein